MTAPITLYSSATTNIDSPVFRPNDLTQSQREAGMKPYFEILGTKGSATITLKKLFGDGSYYSTGADDTTKINANIPGVFPLDYNDEALYKLSISGASGTTISAYAVGCSAA